MSDSFIIRPKRPGRRMYLISAIACWLLLLANVLGLVHEQATAIANLADPYLNNLFVCGAILSAFQYQRRNYSVVKSSELIHFLLQLLISAGVLALGSLTLYVGYIVASRFFIDPNPYLLNALYVVYFGAALVFFAKTYVAWKRMILFHLTKRVALEWEWFEILLLALVLVKLLPFSVLNFVFYPLVFLMLLYVAVISLHLKWVAYLNIKRKWQGIFILFALLICTFIFSTFFSEMSGQPDLVLDVVQHPFLIVMAAFVSLYCLLSLLVSLFNIPTTEVFEQKSEDVLNFQRLSQSIQMGKNESQVYQTLFESALKAAQADGGWLEVINDEGMPEVRHQLNAGAAEMQAFRHLIERYEIGEVDYLNNDLSAEQGDAHLRTGYRSFLKLILRSPKQHYATLYLLKEISQGFDKEQFDVLHTFISQTLVTIDNFRLVNESIRTEQFKKELNIAARIQDSLLPRSLPGNIPLDMSIFSLPAKEVGGDFYDFHEISDDRLAIIIGDVSGKGISAAFYMAQMKGVFQALMQLELLPDQFMILANRALAKSLERSSFITASVYYIDYKMKGLSFARAGHCHTLYHNRGTNETFYFQTEGLGLGIVRDERYAQKIKRLHYDYNPGDVMVLYTDGITEARNATGDEYGTDRMLELLSENYELPATQIKSIIIDDLQKFCANASPYDDQTLVVLKFQ